MKIIATRESNSLFRMLKREKEREGTENKEALKFERRIMILFGLTVPCSSSSSLNLYNIS